MSPHEAATFPFDPLLGPAATGTLVIGYGNSLRRDDGAGPLAAELVARWDRAGVRTRRVHQLVPELAADLALARRAIFLDARAAGPDEVAALAPVTPAASPAGGAIGHASDPAQLLALARWAFGAAPESAWIVTIPAVDLGLGEGLSPTAARGVEAALGLVAGLLDAADGAAHHEGGDAVPCTRSA